MKYFLLASLVWTVNAKLTCSPQAGCEPEYSCLNTTCRTNCSVHSNCSVSEYCDATHKVCLPGCIPGSCSGGLTCFNQECTGPVCVLSGGKQWLQQSDALSGGGTKGLGKHGAPDNAYACCISPESPSVCAASSCTVAGFKDSSQSLRTVNKDKDGIITTTHQGKDTNGAYCKWMSGPNCITQSQGTDNRDQKCWGTVACRDPFGTPEDRKDCDAYGKFCLEAGNSGGSNAEINTYNFRVCEGRDPDTQLSCVHITTELVPGVPVEWNVTLTDKVLIDKVQCIVKDNNGTTSAPLVCDHFVDFACHFSYPISDEGAIVECSGAKDGEATCKFEPPVGPAEIPSCSVVATVDPEAGEIPTTSKEVTVKVNVTSTKLYDLKCVFSPSATGEEFAFSELTAQSQGIHTVTYLDKHANEVNVICTVTGVDGNSECQTSFRITDTKTPTCDLHLPLKIDANTVDEMGFTPLNWNIDFEDDEKVQAWRCIAQALWPQQHISLGSQWVLPDGLTGTADTSSVSLPVEGTFPLGTTEVACEVSDKLFLPGAPSDLDLTGPGSCSTSITVCQHKKVHLTAGQHCKVGIIDVEFVNHLVFVDYNLTVPGCKLLQTHLEINAGPKPIIPPSPGQFDIQETYNPFLNVTKATLILSLEGAAGVSCLANPEAVFEISVMAHAVVTCEEKFVDTTLTPPKTCFDNEKKSETAWGSETLVKATGSWANFFNYSVSCPCGADQTTADCSNVEYGPLTVGSCTQTCGPQNLYKFPVDKEMARNCPPVTESCNEASACALCSVNEVTKRLGMSVTGALGCVDSTGNPCPAVNAAFTFDQYTKIFGYKVAASTGVLKAIRIEITPSNSAMKAFRKIGLNSMNAELTFPATDLMAHCDGTKSLNYVMTATMERKDTKTKVTTQFLYSTSGTASLKCSCIGEKGEFILGWTTQTPTEATAEAASASNGWIAAVIGGVVGGTMIVAMLVAGAFWFHVHQSKAAVAETFFSIPEGVKAGTQVHNTPFISTRATSPFVPDHSYSPLSSAVAAPAATPDASLDP